MAMKLERAYEPKKYEEKMYKLWETSGAFTPSAEGEPYTILMPPPNANDDLHLGHTLTTTIEDILIRYNRMQGKSALFLPGADHAGFETQVVFERKLGEKGKSRFDYSREELYKMIWDYVQDNKGKMEDQQRRIGASVDWSRNTFTLDPHVVERTYETFKKLHEDDLLYRGPRIVNFCTHHGTSFSELEVEYRTQKSKLWHIKYPIEGSKESITVATTRPETMLGDTAVAVHPDDKRYKNLVGKLVNLPLTDRAIPIVADEGVDSAFGTGAVKVTPAHDALDFEIGERHNLPQISVIGRDGKITEEAPKDFQGLTVAEARKKVVGELKKAGVLEKEESYTNSVGYCYKCGTVIEPLIIDQWLVRMKPLAEKALKALEAGEIEIVPARMKKVLFHWLENIKDWNISRQIVWGIPIPAYISDDGKVMIDWKSNTRTIKGQGHKIYHKDPDTFDTWFSSGQWPISTLKYPDHADFKKFYPTSVMETAGEIIFFWVARMIMLGLYVTNNVPFKTVYLHGLVTDEHNHKMSKSKGNVLNPMPLLEKYGADALRMGIIANRSAGLNQGFSEKRVEGYRNFTNKLWNASRYVIDKADEASVRWPIMEPPKAKSLADKWMLAKLAEGSGAVKSNLDLYRFAEALEDLYHLVWHDYADWYLEASKVEPHPEMLAFALQIILKLAHPFAPFVTEAIWQSLPGQERNLITAPWPAIPKGFFGEQGRKEFEQIKELITELRTLKTEFGLSQLSLRSASRVVEENTDLIEKLAGAKIQDGHGNWPLVSINNASIVLEPQQIKSHLAKLKAELKEKDSYIARLDKQLGNKQFVDSAPKEIISDVRGRLAEAKEVSERLDEQIQTLQKAAS